ncbi:MAG: diphthine--ammonia ligase [Thermoplasmatales archaeon]
MKAVALFSGGKDSFLSINIATMLGMDIEAAITVVPPQDSMMFHHPNAMLGSLISRCLGIRSITVSEEGFEEAISKFRGDVLIAGAVESEYQRTRLEQICCKYDLIPFFPLWRKDNESIIMEFIQTGSSGIFTSVAAEGLDEGLLGKEINLSSLNYLKKIREKYGISLIGEGGEYETLVTCPNFGECCIEIERIKIVDRGIQKNLSVEKYQVIPSRNGKRPTGP